MRPSRFYISMDLSTNCPPICASFPCVFDVSSFFLLLFAVIVFGFRFGFLGGKSFCMMRLVCDGWEVLGRGRWSNKWI